MSVTTHHFDKVMPANPSEPLIAHRNLKSIEGVRTDVSVLLQVPLRQNGKFNASVSIRRHRNRSAYKVPVALKRPEHRVSIRR